MANNFHWNEDSFDLYGNLKDTKEKILSVECVGVFKKFFSANQILFYAHMSMVKLRRLFDYVNSDCSFYDSKDFLQKFQTEANFFLFTFLQSVLPYRDAVKNTGLVCDSVIKQKLTQNSEFDFFISLRNFQTHTAVQIFNWTRHYNLKNNKGYADVLMSNELINEIYIFMNECRRKNFQNGGYEFIVKKSDVPIYILANNFLTNLIEFHKDLFSLLKDKYGKDLDECEFYLRKIEEHNTSCILNVLQRAIKLPEEDFVIKGESPRFMNLLRELGGEPIFFDS